MPDLELRDRRPFPELKAWLAETLPMFNRMQHLVTLVRSEQGCRSRQLVEELPWERKEE